MKKFLLSFSLFLISISASAQNTSTNQECNINTEMNDFVKTLFDPKCLSHDDKNARCECLETEKANNFLISELDKKDNIKKYQYELAQKRTEHFWKVYTQMTHGAALQKQIMFGEDKNGNAEEKYVGCPPIEVVHDYKKNIEKHVDEVNKRRRTALETVEEQLRACILEGNSECNVLKHQKKLLEADLGIKGSDQVQKSLNNAQVTTQRADAKAQLREALEFYNSNNEVLPLVKADKVKRINCYLKRLDGKVTEYLDDKCNLLTGELQFSTSTVSGFDVGHEEVDEARASKAPVGFRFEQVKLVDMNDAYLCDKSCAEVQTFIEGYQEERKKIMTSSRGVGGLVGMGASTGMSEVIDKVKDCKADKLCQTFENTNNNALSALQTNFQADPKNCVTYPEFLLKRGIPGGEFMEELAKLPPEKLADALTVPKVLKTKADKQRLRFLRSNPIVAKLAATNAENRKVMAQALQGFAKGVKSKTNPERLDDYLNFMKTTVKDLMKNEDYKSQQQYICKQMINSFTAIQVATDLPPIKDDNGQFPLSSAIRECKFELNNAVSQTKTDDLAMNDLFREVEDQTGDSAAPEKSDAERFQNENKRTCEKYPKFLESCKKTPEECRQDFLAQSKDHREEQKVFKKYETVTDPGKINFNKVANESRASNQDQSFKRWWDRKVGSKMSKSPFPYKGEEAEFAYDQQQNLSKIASTHVPDEFRSKSSEESVSTPDAAAPVSSNSVSQNSVNPGQIIPNFASPAPAFDPSKLTPGQSVTKAITNFENLTPTQKVSGLQEAQKYLADQKGKLEEKDLEEKLEETKEKIAEEKAHQRDLEKRMKHEPVQHSNSAPQFSTAVNQTNHSTGSTGGTGSVSGGSVSRSATISKSSAISNAVNEALKSKEEANTRSPASLKEGEVTVKSGTVKPEELTGKLEISKELTPATSDLFLQMSRDAGVLETYLAQNLNRKEIGNGKIISILNPGTESPVHHMIFKVTYVGGKYLIQSMPSDVQISRSSTLKNLNMNIKQFSKSKKAL